MKAVVTNHSSQSQIVLEPETDDDARVIQELATKTARSHYVFCRGYGYMDPRVTLIIQPIPTSSD
jgi:hypothetical protein